MMPLVYIILGMAHNVVREIEDGEVVKFGCRQACNIMGFLDYLWRRGVVLTPKALKDVCEGGRVTMVEATVVK
jgi:hypothetical protein